MSNLPSNNKSWTSDPQPNNNAWGWGNKRKHVYNENVTESWNHKTIQGHSTRMSTATLESHNPVANFTHLTKHNALFEYMGILLDHPDANVGRKYAEYDKTTIPSTIFLPNKEYNTGCFMFYITPKLKDKMCIEQYKLHDYLPQSVDTSKFQVIRHMMSTIPQKDIKTRLRLSITHSPSHEAEASEDSGDDTLRKQLQKTPTILKYMNQCIKNKRTPTIKEINIYLDQEFDVFVSLDNTRLIASVSDCIQSSIDQDLMFRFEKETKKSTWSKATKYIIFIYCPLPQYCLINDSGKHIVLNEDMNVFTKKLKLFEDFIKKNNLSNENSLDGVHQHSSEATFLKFMKYTANRSFLNMDTEEGVVKKTIC